MFDLLATNGQRLGSNWAHPPQTGNNAHLLSDNAHAKPTGILNITRASVMFTTMKHFTLSIILSSLLATSAAANCFADYKAKQDNPLRLHYGVAQVSACNRATAEGELTQRLASKGWTLLQVMSVFGPEGLDQRKPSAGQYYLRF